MRRIEVWILGQGGATHYGGAFFSWHTVFASLPVYLLEGDKVRWEIFSVYRPSAIQLIIVVR